MSSNRHDRAGRDLLKTSANVLLRLSAGVLLRSIIALSFLFLSSTAYGQSRVEYEIAFPNAAHHEAEVTATFTGAPAGKPLEVRMSRTSPGRYALHEFAKNVYNVRAVDEKGMPLSISRPNPYQWNVSGHKGTARIIYTLFADHASGTYSGIDNTHAHLNMPATFMWARGMDASPIRITFRKPVANWKIATQLAPTSDQNIFTAPNLQYFFDSPTELSNFSLREWPVRSGEYTYKIRLAVHHDGTEQEVDRFAEMTKKVVDEQIAIFGEPPAFDHGTYTFIACYLPYVFGDGMEHRNSTSLTGTRPIGRGARGNLGTVSHEFFHCWNVERIRPRSLEPFDFESANMSGELWLAEGFTSYYGGLTLRRAGFTSESDYARGLGGTLDNVINSPARRFFSAVEMSMQSPLVDGASSVDSTNRQNTYISYYTWGSAIGLALDLTLRSRFKGLTLDDYMRALWLSYGKPEKPYTLDDLESALARLTEDAPFAEDFFKRYIEGREVADYGRLLKQAGFLLRKANPGKVWLDASLRNQGNAAVVASATQIGGPLYEAGLDRGDRIISLDGKTVSGADDVRRIIEAHKPGDKIQVEFEQRGEKKRAQLTIVEDPELEVVTFEDAGQTVNEEIRNFRNQWLGSRLRN
ncbi:MAG: PDZ domain-containing protein [Blastocatellia bacterium]|nr:PDZ domain-containing protein [Blastocatellia bacterium]